jgi:hypothetical protein
MKEKEVERTPVTFSCNKMIIRECQGYSPNTLPLFFLLQENVKGVLDMQIPGGYP